MQGRRNYGEQPTTEAGQRMDKYLAFMADEDTGWPTTEILAIEEQAAMARARMKPNPFALNASGHGIPGPGDYLVSPAPASSELERFRAIEAAARVLCQRLSRDPSLRLSEETRQAWRDLYDIALNNQEGEQG